MSKSSDSYCGFKLSLCVTERRGREYKYSSTHSLPQHCMDGEWSTSCCCYFTGDKYPGLISPRVRLDAMEKRKNSRPCQESKEDSLVVQSVAQWLHQIICLCSSHCGVIKNLQKYTWYWKYTNMKISIECRNLYLVTDWTYLSSTSCCDGLMAGFSLKLKS